MSVPVFQHLRSDFFVTAPVEKYRHPALFYGPSIAVPWIMWSAAGYLSRLPGDTHALAVSVLGFLGLIAPMVVAAALTFRDPDLRSDVLARLFLVRGVRPRYLLAACLLMLASILAAQFISLAFGYSPAQFALARHFSFSSGVVPVWFVLLAAPAIEELAWHSYGTDCLRRRFSLFTTSLLFAGFWGAWHMPLALIKGYYQSNLVESGWIYSGNFLLSIFPFVLLMNWLYYRARRSILVAIIFHVTGGYFNEIFATAPMSKVIQTGLLCIFCFVLIARERGFFFSTADRHRAEVGLTGSRTGA